MRNDLRGVHFELVRLGSRNFRGVFIRILIYLLIGNFKFI